MRKISRDIFENKISWLKVANKLRKQKQMSNGSVGIKLGIKKDESILD